MSDSAQPRHHDDIRIPRALLWAAAALVLFSLAAVMVGRATDRGLSLTPTAGVAETRSLMFAHQPGGNIEVVDALSGQMVALLSADQDGFIRGVLRGLTRGRAVTRTTGADVYVLTRWDDGRLSI
ncbi:MAG: photosynthetic complex assembly protein PuhC, partial [Rubrimonas sp.]